jgi:hypothetical protein
VSEPGFRCSVSSSRRGDDPAGTASTVGAFLLLEEPGPWGVSALRDARLPGGLGPLLAERAAAARVRPLLVRRPAATRRTVGADGGRWLFAAHVHHARSWVETTVLADPADVLDLDLAALGAGRSLGLDPHPGPVFAVCTHGRHDACCAERGRPVVAALAAAHPVQTWEVSHIGGDRFAPNMLVLPGGLYYGRLDADSVVPVVRRHLEGHLDLDHLRGRSCLSMPLQVAEIALRRELGRADLGAVTFRRRVVEGQLTTGHFEVDGSEYAVVVRTTHSDQRHRLTCSATRESAVPHYEVLEVALRT